MTTDSALQRAIDALSIRDVFIVRSESWLADGFEPQYNEPNSLQVSWKHSVPQSQVATLETDTGEKQLLFRVIVDMGMRLNPSSASEESTQPDKQEQATDDSTTCACIEARFIAEYEMQEQLEPDEDAKRAFALQNASYHVWPYWREYLMSQCMRMNLPKVAVPAVQIAKKATGTAAQSNE